MVTPLAVLRQSHCVGQVADVPSVPNMNAAASSGAPGARSTIAWAAARFAAMVLTSSPLPRMPSGPESRIVGWRPKAATKLTSDCGCFRCWPKSAQLV